MLTICQVEASRSDGVAFSCALKDQIAWRIVTRNASTPPESQNETVVRCQEALINNIRNLKRLSEVSNKLKLSVTRSNHAHKFSCAAHTPSPFPGSYFLEPPPPQRHEDSYLDELVPSPEVHGESTHDADSSSIRESAVWNQLYIEARQRKLYLTLTCLYVFRPVIIGLRSGKDEGMRRQDRSLALKLEDIFIPPIEGTNRVPRWEDFVSSAGNKCVYDGECTKADHRPFRDASEDLLLTIDKSSSNLDLANGVFMYSLLMTSLQRIYGNRTFCQYSYKASHSSIRVFGSGSAQAGHFVVPCTLPIWNNPYKAIFWDSRLRQAWNLDHLQTPRPLVSTLDSATALSVIGCNSESRTTTGGGQLLPAHHYVSGMAAAVPLSIFSSATPETATEKMKQRKPRFSFKPAEFTASLRRYLRRRPFLGFSPLHVWWDKAFPMQSRTPATKPANHCRLSFPVRLILESHEGTEEAIVVYHRLVCVESRSVFGQQPDFASGTFVSLVTAHRVRRQLTVHHEGFRNVLMSAYQVHAAYCELLGLEGGARDIKSCPYQAIAEILALQSLGNR